jgi:hypothetical protein
MHCLHICICVERHGFHLTAACCSGVAKQLMHNCCCAPWPVSAALQCYMYRLLLEYAALFGNTTMTDVTPERGVGLHSL